MQPAPVVVPSQTVTERTTTVSPAPAPVLPKNHYAALGQRFGNTNNAADTSQQRTSSYHSETTTVTPAAPPPPW